MNEYNLNEADYLLRECVNAIKGSIDQIYYGLLSYLSEEEQKKFLSYLKNQSDSLQDVLYKSIVEKANKINELNLQLLKSNKELSLLKQSLEEKVRKKTYEIKKIQHVTIFALAKLAESRDQETGDHLSRIRKYSYLLAKEMSLSKTYKGYIDQKYIANIYHSSPLHDIGKVGISDQILLKPGKLTLQEFDIMKSHTIIGGKTLEDAEKQLKNKTKSFLSMGKNIAYCHHEKWDGSGYPFGLKETEIPLSARIIALADVYDALTSKRVYKEAMSHAVARDIIVQSSGKHFDPTVVEAFLRLEDIFKKSVEKDRENINKES
ncbi:MAG TPA: HD domain-containing protein [Spirochaetota bacterium]|nr:HD domain-containing protein [Spirochaetota bacterium]HOL56123.1 HD domain-containing protein [Spirochaetota bacterium]HPP04070.1 HD domain-containing protein [Spirochaetota bacterium]